MDISESLSTAIKNIENLQNLNTYTVPTMPIIRNRQFADYQYEVIMESIKIFEENLDNTHEIAIKLASFGQTILLNITSIGYSNPSLIHFCGYVNGQYAELIQHINQLSFLLLSSEKDDPNRETRRIGFITKNADTTASDSE